MTSNTSHHRPTPSHARRPNSYLYLYLFAHHLFKSLHTYLSRATQLMNWVRYIGICSIAHRTTGSFVVSPSGLPLEHFLAPLSPLPPFLVSRSVNSPSSLPLGRNSARHSHLKTEFVYKSPHQCTGEIPDNPLHLGFNRSLVGTPWGTLEFREHFLALSNKQTLFHQVLALEARFGEECNQLQ